MIKVLVYIGSCSGVDFHRLINPYQKIKETYPDIQVSYLVQNGEINSENIFDLTRGYDIFVFSRLLEPGFIEKLYGTITIVCDNDDFWVLGREHPLYQHYQMFNSTQNLIKHMRLSDYVTTTTQLLADKIRDINKNVFIFDNGLNSELQFENKRKENKRLRFGICGGSSHTHDMLLLQDLPKYLPQRYKDQIQVVLCGFDYGRQVNIYPDGRREEVKMPWNQVCWTQWEKSLSDNYKMVSEEHKQWLMEFNEKEDDPFTDEFYRRLWTKPVDNYATMYDEFDVLLVPLQKNEFNQYKSSLKMVEASIKNCGLIISRVDPYIKDIDNDNCLAVRNKTLNFAQAIMKYCDDRDLLERHKLNLGKLTSREGRYNLDNICKRRAEWLREINNKNKNNEK